MAEGVQSMGEIFAQRRAAAKKGGGNKNQTAPQLPGLFTPVEVGRPPSLADIQEEQKQEQNYSCRKNSNERHPFGALSFVLIFLCFPMLAQSWPQFVPYLA